MYIAKVYERIFGVQLWSPKNPFVVSRQKIGPNFKGWSKVKGGHPRRTLYIQMSSKWMMWKHGNPDGFIEERNEFEFPAKTIFPINSTNVLAIFYLEGYQALLCTWLNEVRMILQWHTGMSLLIVIWRFLEKENSAILCP